MTITVVRARVQSRTMDWSSLVTLGTVACQAPWDSPGKNTGAGCYFLLHRIFLTQPGYPALVGGVFTMDPPASYYFNYLLCSTPFSLSNTFLISRKKCSGRWRIHPSWIHRGLQPTMVSLGPSGQPNRDQPEAASCSLCILRPFLSCHGARKKGENGV